jgi:MFS family permease
MENGSTRGFWSLIASQFASAFNDNALKALVTFLVIGSLSHDERQRMVLVVGLVFSLPFVLFSMTGGYLADRYSKRTVTIGERRSPHRERLARTSVIE